MSIKLEALENISRPKKRRKLLGRGPGSGRGKTSGRGQKGMGARSGYKTRQGYIGGGVPLHKKVPTRGFSNAKFTCRFDVINLEQIEKIYEDGETVSAETLREKGYLKKSTNGLKVLGKGELTKKVKFKIERISESARAKVKDHELNLVAR
ncbi:MAG: 50S ribosomal protein L15 [Chlamydiales bacterium]|nr:50S ribosomal protein L15 [Chlamydiales bacterium]